MRCLVILLALCSGCFIVPKTKTAERVVDAGVTDAPGPAGALALGIHHDGRTVIVKLRAPRTCLAQYYDVVETTTSTGAGIDGPDLRGAGAGGGDAALAGLVIIAAFEMVALPVSGIVTGAVVASSKDEKTTARRVTSVRNHACPVPAVRVAIGLETPTGEVLHAETDERGIARFELPAGAPATGVVTARADGVPAVSSRY